MSVDWQNNLSNISTNLAVKLSVRKTIPAPTPTSPRSSTKVADSGAEVLYLPDYYNVVNLVAAQAKQLGVTAAHDGR